MSSFVGALSLWFLLSTALLEAYNPPSMPTSTSAVRYFIQKSKHEINKHSSYLMELLTKFSYK